jgi:RNA polymerase sigma-70 factor, ECF subfamily
MPLSSVQHKLFSNVVVPHLGEAHRLARYLTGCRADADDVVQETTVRLFRFMHAYRGGDARSWVLRVARNTAYSWLRSNRRPRESWNEDSPDHRGHDPADGYRNGAPQEEEDAFTIEARRQEIDALRTAIDALPSDQREVIVLRDLSGFQYTEIASTLRVPIGTVMSRLSRGRRVLKHRLLSEPRCDI